MMDKFAAIKEAEVRGALAAFVDNGYVDVDSPESFDKLAYVVSEYLPDDYDLNDIAGVTDAVLEKTAEYYDDDYDYYMEKDAEEAAQLALGELAMMKVAGEVDEYEFDEIADGILKEAVDAADPNAKPMLDDDSAVGKRKDMKWYKKGWDWYKSNITFKDLREMMDKRKALKGLEGDQLKAKLETLPEHMRSKWRYATKLGKGLGAWGGTLGAVGALGYGGYKALS